MCAHESPEMNGLWASRVGAACAGFMHVHCVVGVLVAQGAFAGRGGCPPVNSLACNLPAVLYHIPYQSQPWLACRISSVAGLLLACHCCMAGTTFLPQRQHLGLPSCWIVPTWSANDAARAMLSLTCCMTHSA